MATERSMRRHPPVLAALVLSLVGCGSETTDADYRSDIVAQMHAFLLQQAQAMSTAVGRLRDAVPVSMGRGWDRTMDLPAIDSMKNAWNDMRDAWERTEGVLAAMYPDLDDALDQRYDVLLAGLSGGDNDLFDSNGVIGMHAVERILFAPSIPAAVAAREAMLTGYVPASWPSSESQATEFKTGVCTRLYSDIQDLVDRLSSGAVDLESSFVGMTGLMGEQKEKVSLAGDRQDESRYAQRTMADLRQNLAGTRTAYGFFVPWLRTKHMGPTFDDDVTQAFNRIDQTYTGIYGDAIPDPPATWSSDLPTPADQMTPFGRLYVEVVQEVDATYPGSAVSRMNQVAHALGLPEFQETD